MKSKVKNADEKTPLRFISNASTFEMKRKDVCINVKAFCLKLFGVLNGTQKSFVESF